MSAEPIENKAELDGHGTSGVSIIGIYSWLFTFMDKAEHPELTCGVYAYACFWSWSCADSHAFKVDPKDADIIRTPYGPLRLLVCKTMAPGSIIARENGDAVALAANLQCIHS